MRAPTPEAARWAMRCCSRVSIRTAGRTRSRGGPAGAIEAMVEFPESEIAAQPVTAIVCHPLPTEGGSMDNKVVTMAARALRELGVTTVRFNFRGTGASAGEFDHGDGELSDLRAVAEWVRGERADETRADDQGFEFVGVEHQRRKEDLRPR